jgi:hypothetical protein
MSDFLSVAPVSTPPAIVRPAEDLAVLATQINASHEAGEGATRKGLEHFRAAGEALRKAKAACGHGKWLAWLKTNVRCSQQQASRYMRLAKLPVTSNLADQWRVILGNAPDEDFPGDGDDETPPIAGHVIPVEQINDESGADSDSDRAVDEIDPNRPGAVQWKPNRNAGKTFIKDAEFHETVNRAASLVDWIESKTGLVALTAKWPDEQRDSVVDQLDRLGRKLQAVGEQIRTAEYQVLRRRGPGCA